MIFGIIYSLCGRKRLNHGTTSRTPTKHPGGDKQQEPDIPLVKFCKQGGSKIRTRHSEIAVETCRPIAHNVPYVKKLFDKALKICSGSKLIYYCYTSKFLWRIFKKLLFNFDIFNNFYKNRRFIELLLANFSKTKRGNPVGAASLKFQGIAIA